jgi:hypothetical protein
VGNIIKINLYVKMKREKNSKLNLKTIEEVISKYQSWLKMTNREDKIENYEEFLQAE